MRAKMLLAFAATWLGCNTTSSSDAGTDARVTASDAAREAGADVVHDSARDAASTDVPSDATPSDAFPTDATPTDATRADVTADSANDAGPACPPPPADLLDARLGGIGNPLIQRQLSGQIVAIPLPDVAPRASGQVTFSETPSASTPQPVTIEISIHRCRGVIETDTTNYCNLRSTNGTYNSITWLMQPYMTLMDAASVNRSGYCWAPASQGPWYVNARWTYSECGFGSSTCGFAIQHNNGPF